MRRYHHGLAHTFILVLSAFILYLVLVVLIWFSARSHIVSTRSGESRADQKDYEDLSGCGEVRDDIEQLASEIRWSELYLTDPGLSRRNLRALTEFPEEAEELRVPEFLKPDLWDYLHLTDLETIEDAFDYLFGEKLAYASREYATYRNSKGMCLKGVRVALHQVLLEYWDSDLATDNLHRLRDDNNQIPSYSRSPGKSADHFKKWAVENPLALCFLLGLGDASHVSSAAAIPGGVHLYKKGRCGFHRKFGHIEILVNGKTGEACSDHCRVPDHSCPPDMILMPVASCDWLTLYQSLQDRVLRAFDGAINLWKLSYRVDSWRD